jgi:hypothetical protein
MSGRVVIELRKMDSFSSISCEDPREAEAKERRLERRKRGIFRRERRRAMSQDSSASPVETARKSPPLRRGRKEVRRTMSTPHERNSPLPVSDEPVERLSPRPHTCCDSKYAEERWGNRAKRTPDKAPPRCMRKVSMQHGPDCSDDSQDSITMEGDETIVSGLSRWESDPTSTGQDNSLGKTKIRRSKTWSHSGDNESFDTCHLSLFSPPRLPSRKNSDQSSLQELVNALSHRLTNGY